MIPLSLFHIPLFPNTLVECEKEDGGFNQTDQYWKTLRRGMGKIKGAVLVTYPEMTIEVIRIRTIISFSSGIVDPELFVIRKVL